MTAYPAPVPPARDPSSITEDAAAPPRRVLGRRPLSALVTTYNEGDRIAGCLDTLRWCDEILVVDSFSSDDTVAIASRFPRVRVLQRRYFGAASQKNWGIDRLRNDWVLILDADERVTPQLRDEIEEVLAAPAPACAFSVPRRTYAWGRPVRFSGWQHDRVVRLFRRDGARYPDRRVHADMETVEPPARLSAPLEHGMIDSLSEYASRVQRYALWGAAQLWRDGRRAGQWQVAVRPVWRFVRTYLLQLGFLEGVRGLTLCALQAYGTFLKYAILWSWRDGAAAGRSPDLPEFDDDPMTWAWPAPQRAARDAAELQIS